MWVQTSISTQASRGVEELQIHPEDAGQSQTKGVVQQQRGSLRGW